eukprot:CAMPEP_0174331146 /NCGR_PEP_ID=MMETSP0810-20121108/17255_1 /TAXON_ID=73025 ORGANISM="Eutreptiella gymnastica-like, Strain CCMP1594" /NCGR_SAMPLE_ID=MMETSP0810 /ASSEMBLY_ACC=CAM_ASM_000659 /LENGTH=114 /DNA_ID=CAMNT_0015446761 /DNA_START=438 /DNA_END=783 /DNA_ORIENTATION=+
MGGWCFLEVRRVAETLQTLGPTDRGATCQTSRPFTDECWDADRRPLVSMPHPRMWTLSKGGQCAGQSLSDLVPAMGHAPVYLQARTQAGGARHELGGSGRQTSELGNDDHKSSK